jgi:phage FluMu protein Com
MREYRCRLCKKLLLRYGNFHHEFPEYKEVRVEKGVYSKEGVQVKELHRPESLGKPFGLFITVRCNSCGQHNSFTIIFNKLDEKTLLKG